MNFTDQEVRAMDFCTVRDFRSYPKKIQEKLEQDGELVLTNNGKPTAFIIHIPDGKFEETVQTVRQARAMRALNAIRAEAATRGFLSDEEIEAEIQAYRQEKRIKQDTAD